MNSIRRFLIVITSLIFTVSVFSQIVKKPNIILIMADDVSWNCFGTYGAEDYKTPNIDALASEGMKFNHCYSTPICTPSRVKIMTGQYNFRNYTHFGYLNPNDKTFAHLLKDAGYKTAIAGKWQLNGLYNKLEGHLDKDRPQKAGFDVSCLWQVTTGKTGENGGERFWSPPLLQNGEFLTKEDNAGKYGPDIMSDFVCDFIEKNKDEHFFVYYPTVLVHSPFVPTPDTIGNQPRSHDANKTPKDQESKKANYVAMVNYLDKIVGKIVAKVEAVGQLDNTIILFTSDNGTASITSRWNGQDIRGAKGRTVDMGTHVPLVTYWKGHTPNGLESDDLIDFTDFYTTFAEASSIELGEDDPFDGRSFLPQLRGQTGAPRDWVFWQYQPYWGKFKGIQFVRNQTYKLYKDGALYNVPNDIHEKHNLISESNNVSVQKAKNSLQKVLDKAPPAPVVEGGRNATERVVYPSWKNLINPND
ncbi:sulfatase-like hydrolase/transferase [Seonamhaeicola maritimus]|uniref:Sulfatase-like hydrolase/transferase n=1 Tax=Seonamhaeicola maritimus TaxID=2591822 RepID=A0A5C7GJ87_9FLAO|nr:sulfatase-like hydrolase/transferase [Seonamhaeicola maritimus]TXG38392.1 sulfatase-like hydrolase/transferase [Seonamhaeicola maritimus]